MAGAGRRKARPPRKILRLTNDDGSSLLHSQLQEIDDVETETTSPGYNDRRDYRHTSPTHGFKNGSSRMSNDMPPSPTSDMENSPPKLVDFGFERSPPRLEAYWDSQNGSPPREYYKTSYARNQRLSPVHPQMKHGDYTNGRYDEFFEQKYYDSYTNYHKDEFSDRHNHSKYKEMPTAYKEIPTVMKPPEEMEKSRDRSTYKHQHPEPTPEFPYQCETCDMLFKRMELLLDHQKTVHESNRQYACRYCLKKFNDKYNMRKHVLIHVGEKRHKCDFCEKAFLRKDHLRSHLQTHYNKKYGCRFCGRGFRTHELYQRHLGTHREEAKNNPELAIPEIREETLHKEVLNNISKSSRHSPVPSNQYKEESRSPVQRYETQLGYREGSYSPTQPNFSSHRPRSPPSFNSFSSPIPNHSTGVSPRSFGLEEESVSVTILDDDLNLCYQLSKVEDVKENGIQEFNKNPENGNQQEDEPVFQEFNKFLSGFKCKTCPKVFSVVEDLKLHSELCRSDEKFQCSKCKDVFSSSSTLQAHYKQVHSLERKVDSPSRWRCKTCNINYPNSKELSRHYALAHKDAQLFPCSECPKTFTVWHNLKKHMLIHLGDKKHKCTICNKGFVRKDHLNSHLKVHQNESQRFPCPVCPKVFRQKAMFNKHMATHPNVEKYEQNNKFDYDVNMKENEKFKHSMLESENSPQYLMTENSAVQQFIENGQPNRYPLMKDEEPNRYPLMRDDEKMSNEQPHRYPLTKDEEKISNGEIIEY